MRRTTHRPKQPYTGHAVWNTFSKEDCDPLSMAQRICYCFDITDKQFVDLVHGFLVGLIQSGQGLGLYEVKPFVKSCKDRYNELYKLMTNLLDLSKDYQITLTRAKGKPFVKISSETEIHFYSEELEEEIVLNLRLNGHPKIYGYLSKALVRALIIVCAEEGVPTTDIVDHIMPYCQVLLSVGQLYNDLHGDQLYKVLREKEVLAEVTLPPPDNHQEVDQLLDQLYTDIQKGYRAPPYCRDLAKAIMFTKLHPYSVNDFHFSLKKTGTALNGKTLNGLSASTIETDPGWECDEDIGYESFYRKEHLPGTVQPDLKGQTVEQHKLDDRDIRLGSNPIQDRGNWFHHHLERVNRTLPSDCTFDQDRGRRFARQCTITAQREDMCIYCNDIHAATDNISPWFQEQCLSLLFGPKLAQGWTSLVIRPTTYYFSDGHKETFVPLRGQPQGLKSSFPAFAFAHHILMRLVMLACGMTDVKPEDWYRVLGDDSIIYTRDTQYKTVYHAYIRLAAQIGWDVNEEKGCYYFPWESNQPIAEFAKVRYYGGRPLSPLPLQLTLSLPEREGPIAAMLFIAHQLRPIALDRMDQCLQLCDLGEPQIFFIHQLIKNNLGLWAYIDHPDRDSFEEGIAPIVLIHYFRAQLMRTTLSLWLPSEYEHNVFGERERAKKNSMIFLEWLDHLHADDLPEQHKIWQLMFKQERLINILEKAIDDASLSYAGLAMDLSEADQQMLETAAELVADYKLASREEILSVIPKALKILSRFNPRSEARDDTVEGSVLPQFSLDCIHDCGLPIEDVVDYVWYYEGKSSDPPPWIRLQETAMQFITE